MSRQLALLRGVNLGGRKVIMSELGIKLPKGQDWNTVTKLAAMARAE